MNLWGRGKDPLGKKKQHNPFKNSHWKKGQQKQQQQQVWYERGSGTVSDPYVAWLFDCCMEDDLSEIAMLDQTSIVHKVARANGFSCALIRKGSHDKQCVYDNFGTRITTTAPNGNIVAELVDCDPHITLYMGWDCHTAMVSGHIYVMEVADLQAGRVVVKQIDNPDTQRRIVHKGYDRVAEEFWLLGGVYEKR
ncbi:uncharacterized protein B0T15DRAFT_497469 [Chaetomium strumarium]|uniref:Uncharacterized protein n=1 Tax=Chaetomium strumarium TaxID=1170767 RepID=A0AAJ0GKU7_9PEZI|nr:hypothetical protein B0T15DRAFT_497469 [Chaetomium strumarium]